MNFLDSGPAPIYVGFGSLPLKEPSLLVEEVIKFSDLLNVRVVFATGMLGIKPQELERSLPANMLAIDFAPHDMLFPRVRVAVHHAGCNTAGAAFIAGTPSVAIPCFADQFIWAQRIYDLGVGGPPVFQNEFSATRLAESVQVALAPKVLDAALQLSGLLSEEHGAEQAVDEVTRYLVTLRTNII